MAGTPEKRGRREADQLNGKATTPEPKEVDLADLRGIEGAPGPGKRGASKEYMQALVKRRQELAKSDPAKLGGRPPKIKVSREEATQRALDRLEPRALKVLEKQLDSPDPRIQQSAAVKLLEWKRGKPSQSIKVDADAVHTIRYETIAFSKTPRRDEDVYDIEEADLEDADVAAE